MYTDVQILDKILCDTAKDVVVELTNQLDRRMEGPLSPNDRLLLNVRSFRKEKEKLGLCILSHYLGEIGSLIKVELESEFQFPQNLVALSSKAASFEILEKTLSDRDFFGNFLPMLKKILQRLKFFVLKEHRARRKEFRRGYRDHGTLRPKERWLPTNDYSLTEEQNQIEAERQAIYDAVQFLIGYCS